MIIKREDIFEQIQRDHPKLTSTQLVDAANSREPLVELGNVVLISDIHAIDENAVDLEKDVYVLDLNNARQTSCANFRGLMDSFTAQGLDINDRIVDGLQTYNQRYSRTYLQNVDNWTDLGAFWELTRIIKEATGVKNPRAFLKHGRFSGLEKSYFQLVDLKLKFAPLRTAFELLPEETRNANYDFFLQHVSTEKGPRVGKSGQQYTSQYVMKYFDNFRGDIQFEHEWHTLAVISGIAARKRRDFADVVPHYFNLNLEEVLRRDYGYMGYDILRTDSQEGILLVNGQSVARKVVLEKEERECHMGLIPGRMISKSQFRRKRDLFTPEYKEIAEFVPEELEQLVERREAMIVDRIEETLADDNDFVIKEGEMFGAWYTLVDMIYNSRKARGYTDFRESEQDRTGIIDIVTGKAARQLKKRTLLTFQDLLTQRDIAEANRRKAEEAAEHEKEARERIQHMYEELTKYVDPALVEMAQRGERPTELRPKVIPATVLFSDVRGFTSLTEKMDPEELTRTLNSFLYCADKSIVVQKGLIDKYIGDCAMAVFSENDSNDEDSGREDGTAISAARAIRAGLNMTRAFQALNRVRAGETEYEFQRIDAGIGLASGPVNVGNFGGLGEKLSCMERIDFSKILECEPGCEDYDALNSRLDYTNIADCVNACSRIEALTRHFNLGFLIDGETVERLGEGHRFKIRFIDNVKVKNKDEPLAIYEVFDFEPNWVIQMKDENSEDMGQAYDDYREGRFEDALRQYEIIKERCGRHTLIPTMCADPVVDYYIKRCNHLIQQRDGKILDMRQWQGVYNFGDIIPPERSIPIAKLLRIHDMQKHMTSIDLEFILDNLLSELRNLTNAEAGTIYVVDSDERLHMGFPQNDRKGYNLEELSRLIHSGKGVPIESIAGHVSVTGEPLIIDDVYDIPDETLFKFDSAFDEKTGYRSKSMVCYPVADNRTGKVLGVIQLINSLNRDQVVPFSEEDLEYVRIFSDYAANAIMKAQDNREKVFSMVKLLADHDPDETGAHNGRVSEYSVAIAERFWTNRDKDHRFIIMYRDMIGLGARFHDAGKMKVPDSILKKEGSLTEDEYSRMKQHTTDALDYFSGNEDTSHSIMARNIALYHHEKFDGEGYPERKSGEEIPLEARIVAVADVYDALASARCYKSGKPHADVMEIIRKGRGTHFDPEVVDAFLQIEDRVIEIRERYERKDDNLSA